MKIGERLAGISVVRSFFGLPISAGSSAFMTNNGSVDPRTLSLYNRYTGIVYRCIELVAGSAAQGEWDVTKKTGRTGTPDVVQEHEFIKLLSNPHDDFSMYDLLFGSIAFKLMSGEWFWYFAKGSQSGKPMEIYLLHPKQVDVVIDKDTREVIGYKYKVGGTTIPLDLDEVWHHHTFNPNNEYRGLGKLQASLTYVDTELMSSSFTKNFFKNSGTPTGVVYVDTRGKEDFDKFKRTWKDNYGGVENAGKLAFLRGKEVKFTKLSLGLDEIDMKALRDMSKEDVAMMFGVPLELLARTDQSGLGRNVIEAAEYLFAKYTVTKELEELDESFGKIINRYWKSDTVVIKHKNIIPANAEQLLKEDTEGVDKWVTRNEIRARRGLPAVKGGDTLYHGTNQMLIEGSEEQKTKALGTGVMVRLAGRKSKKADSEAERNERFRLELARVQANYEKSVISKFATLLDEQKVSVLSIVAPQKAYDTVFSTDEEATKLQAVAEPLILDLAAEAGKVALRFAGEEELDFDLDRALREAVHDSVARMARNYSEDTLEMLANSLSEGVAAGENLASLKKRVEKVYEDAKGYRAERVARYETQKGANAATEQAYRQSGYVTAKKWYVNPKACEYCRPFHDKQVPLGSPFANIGDEIEGDEGGVMALNYDTVLTPPLHPNCMCTIVPVID
jgi:HK97 family phage portal protein